MLLTRPNVAFTLQWLLTSLASPYLEHLNAAKNLLKYLASTQNLAIIYKGNPEKNTKKAPNSSPSASLVGFYNSDFTGDRASSKLTYAYLFKLASGLIS